MTGKTAIIGLVAEILVKFSTYILLFLKYKI